MLIGRIAKATDENLTSENWELILDVCDQVNAKPDDGYTCTLLKTNLRPRDAIAAATKRFAHRNANVQLYALTVIP
jgi:signal transducing adaptor molecule